ncbi:hypothetical protein MUK42_23960 [Musa troglodytarum]|uniref:Uncharacterized protein n=1 Tax=Musa troglodytarum TaxID=320322 RepID=A0A9E7FKK5_9LILI|nr:hypothetical protein MUK42_23960 [Musa troglodytarum]
MKGENSPSDVAVGEEDALDDRLKGVTEGGVQPEAEAQGVEEGLAIASEDDEEQRDVDDGGLVAAGDHESKDDHEEGGGRVGARREEEQVLSNAWEASARGPTSASVLKESKENKVSLKGFRI